MTIENTRRGEGEAEGRKDTRKRERERERERADEAENSLGEPGAQNTRSVLFCVQVVCM